MRALLVSHLIFLIALDSAPVRAQTSNDQISALERRHALLVAHRHRLDARLGEQTKRITRLKAQPTGVRRDYQLQSALRASQQLAERLTGLQRQLRTLHDGLVAAYDRALAGTESPTRRRELQRRRAALLAPQPTRIVVSGRVDPLASADDLEERADLLGDSAAKVNSRLQRIRQRIAWLERRYELRRHGHAADDSPFIESAPRRLGRAIAVTQNAGTTTIGSPNASQPPSEQTSETSRTGQSGTDPSVSAADFGGATPTTTNGASTSSSTIDTSATSSGNAPNSPTLSPSGSGSFSGAGDGAVPAVTLQLRSVLDPATFRELQQALKGHDLIARLAALKKAEGRLEGLEHRLNARAEELRRSAKGMRRSTGPSK